MEEKYNESTINRPEGERPIDAGSLLIDIPAYIKQIKNENQWEKNDRNAIVVFKTDKMRIVLIALHAYAEMSTLRPENLFSLQLLDGKVKINLNQEFTTIEKGQILAMHDKIPYSIVAEEESVFLLTVIE